MVARDFREIADRALKPGERPRIEGSGEQPDFEFVESIERQASPPDRPAPPPGCILDPLKGDQGIDAADGFCRRRRARRPGRLLVVESECAGAAAPRLRRVRGDAGAIGPVDAHSKFPRDPKRRLAPARNVAPVWLMAG